MRSVPRRHRLGARTRGCATCRATPPPAAMRALRGAATRAILMDCAAPARRPADPRRPALQPHRPSRRGRARRSSPRGRAAERRPQRAGRSTPPTSIAGLLLLEDFGDRVFGRRVRAGTAPARALACAPPTRWSRCSAVRCRRRFRCPTAATLSRCRRYDRGRARHRDRAAARLVLAGPVRRARRRRRARRIPRALGRGVRAAAGAAARAGCCATTTRPI